MAGEADLDHADVRVPVGLLAFAQAPRRHLAEAAVRVHPFGDLRLVEMAAQKEIDSVAQEAAGLGGIGQVVERMVDEEEPEAGKPIIRQGWSFPGTAGFLAGLSGLIGGTPATVGFE